MKVTFAVGGVRMVTVIVTSFWICNYCITSHYDNIEEPMDDTTRGDTTLGGDKDRNERNKDPSFCPSAPLPASHLRLPNIFREAARAGSEQNAVLVESSCTTAPSYRVWCALESLAQQNPKTYVWYFMVSGVLGIDGDDHPGTLLPQQYPNLRPVSAPLTQVFAGTPLEDSFEAGTWNANTDWPEVNLADLMRLALVWHLGSFYVDSDVVCIRSLHNLTNVVAWQELSTIGSGAFHFHRHHSVLEQIMSLTAHTFKADQWGSGGPHAFTSIIKQHCEGNLLVGGKAARCEDLTLLPIQAFYPVPALVWKTIFMPQARRSITKRYRSSYLLHTWNQLSHGQPIIKDSGSIYDEAARQFCPLTRQLATTHSLLY